MTNASTLLVARDAGEPWNVEIYADPMPAQAAPPGDIDRDVEEYTELGFAALARRTRQLAGVGGHLLTDAELAVWRWRYPSSYNTDRDRDAGIWFGQAVRAWASLEWPVPRRVRDAIAEARPSFDALEVWTPELRRAPATGLSPILVGVRGGQRFLLARWAEALEPFEAIASRSRSRRGRWALAVRKRYQFETPSAGGIGAVFMLLLFSSFSWMALSDGYVGLGVALVGVGVAAAAACVRDAILSTGRAVRRAADYAGWVFPAEEAQ
jgi:hypothetical protein